MFDAKAIQGLVDAHGDTFALLARLERDLQRRFTGLDDVVEAVVLAMAAGEFLLLIGPPGTGKSQLVRTLCGLLGFSNDGKDGKQRAYFEYLLTPFTEPGELFGYYDVGKAMEEGSLERMSAGMLQNATVAFLDEVFNGSSAILNSLLAIMNERIFHDRNVRQPVKLKCLFGATNSVPQTPELQGLYDRFLLRCEVHNVAATDDALAGLFATGWRQTYAPFAGETSYEKLLGGLELFQKDVRRFAGTKLLPAADSPAHARLASIVSFSRCESASEMSNRRLVKIAHLLLVSRVYQAAKGKDVPRELQPSDYQLIGKYCLDAADEEQRQRIVNLCG